MEPSSQIEDKNSDGSRASKRPLILTFVGLILLVALVVNLVISFEASFQEINFIKSNPNLSYEEKMHLKLGEMFNFLNFVRNHTPQGSVIMIPPQHEPPWNISGNQALISYFLYPNQVVNGPNENSEAAIRTYLNDHPNITHLLLTSEQGALWPNIPPQAIDEIEVQTYRSGWGVIRLPQ